jgi:hypothetical protein
MTSMSKVSGSNADGSLPARRRQPEPGLVPVGDSSGREAPLA